MSFRLVLGIIFLLPFSFYWKLMSTPTSLAAVCRLNSLHGRGKQSHGVNMLQFLQCFLLICDQCHLVFLSSWRNVTQAGWTKLKYLTSTTRPISFSEPVIPKSSSVILVPGLFPQCPWHVLEIWCVPHRMYIFPVGMLDHKTGISPWHSTSD